MTRVRSRCEERPGMCCKDPACPDHQCPGRPSTAPAEYGLQCAIPPAAVAAIQPPCPEPSEWVEALKVLTSFVLLVLAVIVAVRFLL